MSNKTTNTCPWLRCIHQNKNKYKPTAIYSVEICLNNRSRIRKGEIESAFKEYSQQLNRFHVGKMQTKNIPPSLSKHVNYIQICLKHNDSVSVKDAKIILYIFRNNNEGPIEEIDDETSDEPVNVANTYTLPNEEFDGLYERYSHLHLANNQIFHSHHNN